MKNIRLITILFFLPSLILIAQRENKTFSISIGANYTTTSKLFMNPYSIDEILKYQYDEIEGLSSYNFDLRYRFMDEFELALSIELMRTLDLRRSITVRHKFGSKLIPVSDGFEMIPIELSTVYIMPFSTSKFDFYMYAGIGYYLGRYLREFGNAELQRVDLDSSPGLHVGIGSEYFIEDYFSVRGDMKFREPIFSVRSEYKNNEILYEGEEVQPAKKQFDSKITVDGITFHISAVLHF